MKKDQDFFGILKAKSFKFYLQLTFFLEFVIRSFIRYFVEKAQRIVRAKHLIKLRKKKTADPDRYPPIIYFSTSYLLAGIQVG